eukprot:tig00000808_g4391.t1
MAPERKPSASDSRERTGETGSGPTERSPLLRDKAEPRTRWERLIREIQKDSKLLGYLVLMIFFGSVNRITFKLMLDSMKNYPFFLNQLTSFVYLPIFFSWCWSQMYMGKFPMEQTRFPKRRFLIMGLLDAVQGVCVTFAGSAVSLAMQPLLGQGIIPTTMLLSYIFLKVRFRLLQYAGALTIFAGIVVSLYPALSAGPAGGSGAGSRALFFEILFFCGNIPSALSTVYKEIVFKEDDIDVMYMVSDGAGRQNAYVAFFQFLLGVLSAPLAVAMDDSGTLTMAGIPRHLWQGTLCFVLERDSTPGDACGAGLGARASGVLYMAVNIFYNILLLLVLKYSSATLLYVASTVILPLVSLCSASQRLMGPSARPLSAYDVGGLVLILGGLAMYRAVREGVAGAEAAASDSEGEEERERSAVRHEISFAAPSSLALAPFGRLPPAPFLKPRTVESIRNSYFRRVGIVHPTSPPLRPTPATPPSGPLPPLSAGRPGPSAPPLAGLPSQTRPRP